jgi:PBSX family phage portal protein
MSTPEFYIVNDEEAVESGAFEQYAIKSEVTEESQQIKDPFSSNYGSKGLIQPKLDPYKLAKLSKINTYHRASCRIKSNDVGGLGYTIKPIVDDPNEKNKTILQEFFEGSDEILEDILRKNRRDIEELGYAVLEVIRTGYAAKGIPKKIAHIPAKTVRIHEDENKYCQIRGTKERWFKKIGYPKDVDKETGEEFPLGYLSTDKRATEVILSVKYSTDDEYYGEPDSVSAHNAILGDKTRAEYNISFFENYGVPTYAVSVIGDFDQGKKDPKTGKTQMQKNIEDKFKTFKKNPHSVMITTIPSRKGAKNVEIKFEKLSVETKEASFRMYRVDNRDEILTSHGVDPNRAGVITTGALGGNVAAETKKNYKESVVIPQQRTLAALINKYIVKHDWGFKIFDYRFELKTLDTDDLTQKIDNDCKLMDHGALSPNELRRRNGLEPVTDNPLLDMYYLNNIPLEEGRDSDPVVANLENLRDNIIREVENNAKASTKGDRPFRSMYNGFKKFKPFKKL